MADQGFTHLDEHGAARMVDVVEKAPTARRARATGHVQISGATFDDEATLSKVGISLNVVALACRRGVRFTSELIPLCHPLRLDSVTIALSVGENVVTFDVTVELTAPTGVEMEALSGVTIGALELIAQCNTLGLDATAHEICVAEKAGGRSGSWHRTPLGTVVHQPS